MADIGKICAEHEACISCPCRVECTIRPTFYDEAEYNFWRASAVAVAKLHLKALGYPPLLAQLGVQQSITMMDKRRQKELELFPEYSPT